METKNQRIEHPEYSLIVILVLIDRHNSLKLNIFHYVPLVT